MPKKTDLPSTTDNILITAAKSVGTAAGKMASVLGVTPETPLAKSTKVPKLPKKNKSRLPRRQKKVLRERHP